MHKPLERFYNYLAKAFDKKTDEMDAKRKKWEEAMLELYGIPFDEDTIQRSLQGHKSLPPCDAKNPCRFL